MDNGAKFNIFKSNVIKGPGQPTGIYIANSTNNIILRNVIANHTSDGIKLSGSAKANKVINNTIVKNLGNGLNLQNVYSSTLYNNIIMSNGNGAGNYGINNQWPATVFAAYNDIFSNFSGPTNGGVTLGAGNVYGNPLMDTVTSYTITSILSAALDSGTTNGLMGIDQTPVIGFGRDMGWKESGFVIVNNGPYYVATTGLDSNPGTKTLPFRTIQHAANIMAPGVNICHNLY